MDNLLKIKKFAKEHDMPFEELKKIYLKSIKDKNLDEGLRKNKKIPIKKRKTSTRKKRTSMRKKKEVDMEKNNKEDAEIYESILEKVIINETELFVPIKNEKVVDGKYVYDKKGTRVGVTVKGKVLLY
jgi:hypothetical protein